MVISGQKTNEDGNGEQKSHYCSSGEMVCPRRIDFEDVESAEWTAILLAQC